jgi:hypothetical protein
MTVPEDMIHKVTKSEGHPIVRIDQYKGEAGWSSTVGKGGGSMSVGHSNENNHDRYLSEFIKYAHEFIDASGMDVKEAMNVILSTRNGDRERNRMRAAKNCASIAPRLRLIREFFEARGFTILVDAYDYNDVWLFLFGKGASDSMSCLNLSNPDTVGIGAGDGYHRCAVVEHDVSDLEGVLKKVIEENAEIQHFIKNSNLCTIVAEGFMKEIDIDIKFLTDGMYVYTSDKSRLIVFGDMIKIYEDIENSPVMELRYEDPATTPEKLQAVLEGF